MTFDDINQEYHDSCEARFSDSPTTILARRVSRDVIAAAYPGTVYAEDLRQTLQAMEEFANEYGIPFDKELIREIAMDTSSNRESWDSSLC